MSGGPLRKSLLFCAIATIFVAPASAADRAGFYRGKTIKVYVAGAEGDGYGRYGRLLIDFMPAQISGRPAMQLKFMTGDGGVRAANFLYTEAPKDGTAIALLLASQPTYEAIGRSDVKYKSVNLNWIGRIADIVSAITVRRSGPATTLEEMRKVELVAGAAAPGSVTHMPFAMMNWALGTRFRIVNGYKGQTGPALAFFRGEVQAVAASWDMIQNRRPEMLREIQIAQVGLRKDRAHKDVPLLLDLVDDPEKKAAVTFLSAQGSIGRTVSAPPLMPEERLLELRKAFDATMKDPGFLAAAKKRKMRLAPLRGTQVEQMVLEHLATPEGIIRIARDAAGMQ